MPLFSENRLLNYVTAKATKPTRQVVGYETSTDGTKTPIIKTATQAAAGVQAETHQAAISGAGVPTSGLKLNTGAQFTDEQLKQQQQDYYTQYGASSPELEAYAFNRQLIPTNFDTQGLTQQEIAAKSASIAAQNAAILQQNAILAEEERKKAAAAAASGAAGADAQRTQVTNPTTGQVYTGAAGDRLQGRLDRQAFIEQKRQEGLSDAQIRTMIDTLPPEQTGGKTPTTTPTVAPTTTTEPTATPDSSAPTTTPKEGGTETPPPTQDPSSNLLRDIANTVEDPILRAVLIAEANRADALAVSDPMGFGAFQAGPDGQAISRPYDAIDKILDRAYDTANRVYSSQKTFLKEQHDRSEKLMADREENIKNQLSFANDKAVRDQADANKKRLDSQTIILALGGGFGSADGNREIAEARLKGEQAIIDLNKEFGFKNTDVSLQFTELLNQADAAYTQAWNQATDNFETRVSNIDIQGITNNQAENAALSSAYSEYVSSIKEARAEQAKVISGATKMVYDTITQQKAENFKRDQSVISQAQWAITTYGSGAKPFIEKLAKENPGVNLAGLVGGQTLDEANQNFDNQLALMREGRLGGGGGGGLSGFSSSMMQGDGSIPPTFENFLAQKEKESFARGDVKFDTSANAMSAYRQEYDARASVSNKLNPSEIVNRFAMKAGVLSGPSRKYAESQLQEYLNAGQFQLASDFVDNTGADISATQENDFIQALNSRYNVQKMQSMFDEIGVTYPGVGIIRNLNPLDDRVVRYKQNLTQTIPALARGIFKEVGVLTDTDIERYTSSIANPNLTQAQARNAFNDLVGRINVSMQNQISVWDANGKRIKGVRDLYEAEPLGLSTNSPALQADEDYARSILLGQ